MTSRRAKRCANCKRDLSYVLHTCRKCRKNFCSPAIRDCVLVHGCGTDTVGRTIVERIEYK
jgi:hypothetical protein